MLRNGTRQEIITREQHDALIALMPDPKGGGEMLHPQGAEWLASWQMFEPPVGVVPGMMGAGLHDRRSSVYRARQEWADREGLAGNERACHEAAWVVLDQRATEQAVKALQSKPEEDG